MKDPQDYRTSISCMNSTRISLRKLAVHPRETDEDIIKRLIIRRIEDAEGTLNAKKELKQK